MNDWLEELNDEVLFHERQASRADALRLHRGEIIKSESKFFFDRLKQEAERGAVSMATRHGELRHLKFEPIDALAFRLTNSDRPATVDVTFSRTRIVVRTKTRPDPVSQWEEKTRSVVFGLNSAD